MINNYIYEAMNLEKDVINQAVSFAETFKYSKIDLGNREIIIPFDKNITEEDVMAPGMIGRWYRDNGFDIEFTVGDYDYTTKDVWTNYKGWNRQSGHQAWLRNRLIATIHW